MTVKIYQAGPIANVDDNGHGWRDRLADEYPEIDWQNPLQRYADSEVTFVPPAEADNYDDMENVVPQRKLTEADKKQIRESDGFLVGYLEHVPSWGTAMETLYASQRGKPSACWLGEGVPYSPWRNDHVGFTTEDRDEAVGYLLNELHATAESRP